jgi:hypothetical protein
VGSHDPLFSHGVGGTINPDFPAPLPATYPSRMAFCARSGCPNDAMRQLRRIACKRQYENPTQNQDDGSLERQGSMIKQQNRSNTRYDALLPPNY